MSDPEDVKLAEISWRIAERAGLAESIREIVQERDDARRQRDQYHDALIARHGGEPIALLSELDDARRQLEEAQGYVEKLKIDISGLKGTIGQQYDLVADRTRQLEALTQEREYFKAKYESACRGVDRNGEKARELHGPLEALREALGRLVEAGKRYMAYHAAKFYGGREVTGIWPSINAASQALAASATTPEPKFTVEAPEHGAHWSELRIRPAAPEPSEEKPKHQKCWNRCPVHNEIGPHCTNGDPWPCSQATTALGTGMKCSCCGRRSEDGPCNCGIGRP